MKTPDANPASKTAIRRTKGWTHAPIARLTKEPGDIGSEALIPVHRA